MEKWVIDRIEGSIAILESLNDLEILEINIEDLPIDSKEGTVLVYKERWETDKGEEEKRREDMRALFEKAKRIGKDK